jgi:beta-lactamase regulating signal transducer with metallopeptidase domain
MDATLIAKVTLVEAFALLAFRLWPGRSPGVRHARWTATFCALLALPFVAQALPGIPVAIPVAFGPLLAIADTPWLFRIWMGGALVAFAGILFSTARVAVLARRSTPIVDTAWLMSVSRLGRAFGLSRTPRLLLSSAATTPMTGGLWRPVVFIPHSAVAWDAERRDIVLAHECAHVASHDALRHFGVRLTAALYWFHPLVWIAVRRAAMAREQACDQAVVDLGVRPSTYARVLVEIHDAGRPAIFGAIAIGDASTLEVRVRGILDADVIPPSRRTMTLSVAGVIATSLAVTLLTPALQTAVPQLTSRLAGEDIRLVPPRSSAVAPRRRPRTFTPLAMVERAGSLEDARVVPQPGDPMLASFVSPVSPDVSASGETAPVIDMAAVSAAEPALDPASSAVAASNASHNLAVSSTPVAASPTVTLAGRADEFYRGTQVARDVRALSASQLGMGTDNDAAMNAYLAMLAGPTMAPPQSPAAIVNGLALSNLVIGATDVSNSIRDRAREGVVVRATSRREFEPTDRIAAFLRVSQSGSHPPASADLTTSIVSSGRNFVLSEALHVEPDDFGAVRRVDYRYRLPVDDLAPGDYVLTIRVDSASRSAERSVRFRVN